MAVCFSVCLIVCVSPVLAANDEYTSGVIYPESSLAIRYLTAGYDLDILSGYFPATFSSDDMYDPSQYKRNFSVAGDVLPHASGSYSFTVTTPSQFYIEVLYSVPASLTMDIAQWNTSFFPSIQCQFGVGVPTQATAFDKFVRAEDISLVVDSDLTPLSLKDSAILSFFIPTGSYNVTRYWGYRFYFNPLSISSTNSVDLIPKLNWTESQLVYTFSDPDYLGDIKDNVTVNTGVLQEINGTLKEIQTSTTQIQVDLSDIKDTVSDTHDQLENPNSNIWQAAGSAISGAIESLFVPSEQDIANVKQGFDDLAQDKLGGAYTAMETVEDTITQVNDKLNNPSAAEGVEFPGIAVPLGGEVGTVVLAERQMVTLPMELTAILHPLGGTIISIIAGLGTFNVLKDMVECFLSGFSYAEYLHRNKGGSDE